MKNITLLFPGQGSQYIGMGKNLNTKRFETTDRVLGFPLSKIIFEGKEEELKLTQNTQPAILTYSIALLDELKKINLSVVRVLGHSLGEYSALVSAGVLSFEDAVKAVYLRGKYMQEAVPSGLGKMFAIKYDEEKIELACKKASTESSFVAPANFNGPHQTVISGHAEACLRAIKILEESGDRIKTMELQVSAPFHSLLMSPAKEALKKHLDTITFNALEIPYIANVDAKIYEKGTEGLEIKNNLVKQVTSGVKWAHSIRSLPQDTICVEVGPGKVLAGLVSKINPELKTISLDTEGGFELLTQAIS